MLQAESKSNRKKYFFNSNWRLKKSIKFNELREKEQRSKVYTDYLCAVFRFSFFPKNCKLVGIPNWGTKHEYQHNVKSCHSQSYFCSVHILRAKMHLHILLFGIRQKAKKLDTWHVQGSRHNVFLQKLTPPSPSLSTIDRNQKPSLAALPWKFVTTNKLSTCFSPSLATSKGKQYSV